MIKNIIRGVASGRIASIGVMILVTVPICSLWAQEDIVVKDKEKHIEKEERKTAKDGEKSDSKIFGFELGFNSSYSNGVETKSIYYQPYGNIYVKHTYVKFTAGLSRFWNYEISNGEGDYEKVNFTQPNAALSLYPHKVVELFGEYRYSTGDPSHFYRAYDGTAGFNLDFDVVTLGASFNKKITEYTFKSDDRKDTVSMVFDAAASKRKHITLLKDYKIYKVKNKKQIDDISVAPLVGWSVHDAVTLDFGYEYKQSDWSYSLAYFNNTYHSHSGRIGVFAEVWKYISISAGINAGKDSEDYIIAGGDAGVIFNILDYVKISCAYLPSYYMAPQMDPTKRKLGELLSIIALRRRRNANPYIRMSNIGKSFWNHDVSFNISYKY